MVEFFKKKEKPKKTPAQERREEMERLIAKYNSKLKRNLQPVEREVETEIKPVKSIEYLEFKNQYMPRHMNWYEKACQFSEKVFKISPDPKKLDEYKEAIEVCHLNITPEGAVSFAIVGPLILALILGVGSLALGSLFFTMFFLVAAAALIGPLQKYPLYLASSWRMKASNQMVLCVFYVVTYMRHTSNLELAIEFAADHLSPPLSIDLRKVLWNIETEKYSNIKESLDAYLDTWKKYNLEFIEAFHLIESSLYEGSDDRRVELLDKSLTTILEETYEKMLLYAQNLKGPLTMLNMLGIILPILGLVILPLIVSFMCQVQWYHIAMLYDVALPIGVYYLTKNILATRPTGYGDTDISDANPEVSKYKNIIFHIGKKEILLSPFYIAVIVGLVCIFISLLPLMLNLAIGDTNWDIIIDNNNNIKKTFDLESRDTKYGLLEYKISKGCPPGAAGTGDRIGPFGLGASILSVLFIVGLGVGIGLYFKLRSKNIIAIRNQSKELEKEFASALFQLGNRLGDGLPAEIAFSKVAEVMSGSISGKFFMHVSSNITRLGMSVEQAIFHPEYGALIYYPSSVIESSMKVLTESAKKGPMIAAQAVINVSRYIKEIHRVDERLKDLMADVISSLKSQISFLTPVISGIVIGITSMITTILSKLGVQIRTISQSGEAGAAGGATGLIGLFGDGMPTYYFQIIVGIYVVQIIYIMTKLTNGVENGEDKLNERYLLGKNMVKSVLMYVMISLFVMLLFNIIASSILGRISLG